MSAAPPRASGSTAEAGGRRATSAAPPVRILVAVVTAAILLAVLVWDPDWRAIRAALSVLAARCAGQRELAILLRHILPNVKQVVLAQFSMNVAWAIQILAALSFVGLGVPVPTPEWGAMVRDGYEQLVYGRWWVALFPGLAILATVLTLNQLSDRVRHTT